MRKKSKRNYWFPKTQFMWLKSILENKKKSCKYDHARGGTEELNESQSEEEGNKRDERAQGVRENVNN